MASITVPRNTARSLTQALTAAMETAGVASSKATSLHTAEKQKASVVDGITKLYDLDKALPLLVAMQPGTRFYYMREVLLNELEKGTQRGRNIIMAAAEWDGLSEAALNAVIAGLSKNPAQLLRTFAELDDRQINNARTRRIVLSYLLNHPRLEFWAVKYRGKLRKALTHLWGRGRTTTILRTIMNGEPLVEEKVMQIFQDYVERYSHTYAEEILFPIILFIFGHYDKTHYTKEKFKYISQWELARTDVLKGTLIPEEILVGMLGNNAHPQHSEWLADKAKMLEKIRNANKVETANVAVRKTKQEKKAGITRERSRVAEVDDMIALLKTAYANGRTPEIQERLLKLAQDRKVDIPYATIGILTDKSWSMRGHHLESKDTPRAITEFTELVLRQSADFMSEETGSASSDLASGFVELMSTEDADRIEAVFVLSDGYENAPYEGAFSDVVKAWNEHVGHLPVYHISPYSSAEINARARPLGEGVVSLAATYENLGSALQAQALEADVRLWLQAQVDRLEASNG